MKHLWAGSDYKLTKIQAHYFDINKHLKPISGIRFFFKKFRNIKKLNDEDEINLELKAIAKKDEKTPSDVFEVQKDEEI